MKRAQIAMEYMVILGFVTFMITSLIVVSYYYKGQLVDNVNLNQVDQIARNIVDKAEEVYYLGSPTKTTIKVEFPDKIEEIIISDYELNFKVKTKQGVTEIPYSSNVKLQGSLNVNPGLRAITIEAKCDVECYAEIS